MDSSGSFLKKKPPARIFATPHYPWILSSGDRGLRGSEKRPYRSRGGSPRGIRRVRAQEPDDDRDVADSRNGCVAFPVGNREFVNADLVGNLLLQELEIQAALWEVVA